METTELMETAGPSTIPADRAELTVGEVARDSGVSASAVRFYEKHAVVTADRTAGNQRRFGDAAVCRIQVARLAQRVGLRSEEHTSELQSRGHLVCRLLLEKKKRKFTTM